MKKLFFPVMVAAAILVMSMAVVPSAFSMDDPGFTIAHMAVSENVVDREAVGIGEIFPVSLEKVYCFLEAKDIQQDTEISFVWYHAGNEVARVALTLRQGNRWRTYSSKNLAGLKGDWKVELQDATGIVHNTVSFTVE